MYSVPGGISSRRSSRVVIDIVRLWKLRMVSRALWIFSGITRPPGGNPTRGSAPMADKVKKLGLDRDYKKYLYFIDGSGNVSRKPKSGEGNAEVLVENAVERDNRFLYFIDKDGDIARSERGTKKSKNAA